MGAIGLVVHRTRPEALAFAATVRDWLHGRGYEVWFNEEAARVLGTPYLPDEPHLLADLQLLITLGGDGTILTAARIAAPKAIPILGVHMGRFGFITETHPDALFPQLEAVLAGRVQFEERLMVQAEVWREDDVVFRAYGLNEAVVKSGMTQLLRLKTFLGGAAFATYPADGVIVATPTGSTAYSLSAGGPLVAPTVQALIITPICPHTLSARPLIVPGDETVEIEIESDGGEVRLTVDSASSFTLLSDDRVIVRRSEFVTRLVILDHATFYRKVRDRYLYGERLNG